MSRKDLRKYFWISWKLKSYRDLFFWVQDPGYHSDFSILSWLFFLCWLSLPFCGWLFETESLGWIKYCTVLLPHEMRVSGFEETLKTWAQKGQYFYRQFTKPPPKLILFTEPPPKLILFTKPPPNITVTYNSIPSKSLLHSYESSLSLSILILSLPPASHYTYTFTSSSNLSIITSTSQSSYSCLHYLVCSPLPALFSSPIQVLILCPNSLHLLYFLWLCLASPLQYRLVFGRPRFLTSQGGWISGSEVKFLIETEVIDFL